MGLTCNKLQSGSRSSESFEKAESWARTGGYVFRPVFRNEIHESTYEKTQLNYNLSWRKEEASLRRRQSLRENPLINQSFLENLRDKLRLGVPDRLAREIILKLFYISPSDEYWRILKDNFEGNIPDTFISVPTFSSINSLEQVVPKFYINSNGIIGLKRILWALCKEFECIKFCPQLPPLISLLLVYINEEDAFYVCKKILGMKDFFLIQSKSKLSEFVSETVILIEKSIPVLSQEGKELNKLVSDMIMKMFVGYFRINCLMRIVIAFLTEGVKFLQKFIVSVLSHYLTQELRVTSLRFNEKVKTCTYGLYEIDTILSLSFKIKTSEDESDFDVVDKKSSCIAQSKVASEQMVNEILSLIGFNEQSENIKTIYSGSPISIAELLGSVQKFYDIRQLLFLFITNNLEIFGFFVNKGKDYMMETMKTSDVVIFQIEPEKNIVKVSKSVEVTMSAEIIQIKTTKQVVALFNDMKYKIDNHEEYGLMGFQPGEYEVSLCEILGMF